MVWQSIQEPLTLISTGSVNSGQTAEKTIDIVKEDGLILITIYISKEGRLITIHTLKECGLILITVQISREGELIIICISEESGLITTQCMF